MREASRHSLCISAALSVAAAQSYSFGGKAPVWLGATDVADGARTEGYFWTNGDPFAYTNWHPGEPNNGGGSEDYVALGWQHAAGYSADPSTWNDLAPQGTQGFGG